MAIRQGKCINFGNCKQADSRALVEVRDGADFICECGHPLHPVPRRDSPWKGLTIAVAAGIVLLGGILAYRHLASTSDGPPAKVGETPPQPERPRLVGSSGEEGKARVRVAIWVGNAGGLAANGGLDTQPGSIFDKQGIRVSFKILDDWTEAAAAFASGNVDVMQTTVDVWAKDYAKFKEKNFKAKAFLMVDWSHGADGVIGKEGIRRIEDLADKSIAFAEYTPSHFLLWYGLKNSGLSRDQRNAIMNKAIHTKDGIEPATLFAQGKVEAAVAWDPDMTEAISKRPGSRKIYDTTAANKLVADVLVASESFMHEHPDTVRKLTEGWLRGVDFIAERPERAYNLIGGIKDFNIPSDAAKTMLEGAILSNYSENECFFASAYGGSQYDVIFSGAQEMYRELLQIKGFNDPEETVTHEFILPLKSKFKAEKCSHPDPGHYQHTVISQTSVPISEQHRTINFDTNSAQITADSGPVVDEIGKFMRAYEETVLEIVGNTDSVGDRKKNIKLSEDRADAVKAYLISKFAFPAERIRTHGAGPANPVCREKDFAADSVKLGECRQQNRRSDIRAFTSAGK